eukprot:UN0564
MPPSLGELSTLVAGTSSSATAALLWLFDMRRMIQNAKTKSTNRVRYAVLVTKLCLRSASDICWYSRSSSVSAPCCRSSSSNSSCFSSQIFDAVRSSTRTAPTAPRKWSGAHGTFMAAAQAKSPASLCRSPEKPHPVLSDSQGP